MRNFSETVIICDVGFIWRDGILAMIVIVDAHDVMVHDAALLYIHNHECYSIYTSRCDRMTYVQSQSQSFVDNTS